LGAEDALILDFSRNMEWLHTGSLSAEGSFSLASMNNQWGRGSKTSDLDILGRSTTWGAFLTKGPSMFEKKQSYTPAEAKRAYDQLNHLVAERSLTPRQDGAYKRYIASRVRVSLKPAYNP
jgi:hypothetical protein